MLSPDLIMAWEEYLGSPGPGAAIRRDGSARIYLPHYPARTNKTPGKRFRAFCFAVNAHSYPESLGLTIDEFYEAMRGHGSLSELPFRIAPPMFGNRSERLTAPTEGTTVCDPELHRGLQDVGWMIGWDIMQAAEALDNPDVYYAGVDDGIEPVPDDHVDLVIWALQRELNREKRGGKPPIPLGDLPRRVQRALAERRRLRYAQWGLGRQQWQTGVWSLWDVPEDPDWLPPWLVIH